MIKKFFCILIVIVLGFTCGACWNKKEPKELAAVLSIVYDIDEQGKTPMIVELLDTRGQGGQDISKLQSTKVIKLYGDTAAEGIRDTIVTVDRTMYGAHNKARIFTERLARDGLNNLMDFFLRDHLTDERPILLVVKNEDPLILYEADTGLSSSLGTYIDQLARTRKDFSEFSLFLDTLDFMRDFYCQGKQPVMGVVEAVPDDAYIPSESIDTDEKSTDRYQLVFNGLAVFREDKLLGYLDKFETRVYNALVNNIKSAYTSVPVGDEFVAGNCLKTKASIKTKWQQEKVQVDVEINKEIMLSQNNTEYDVGDIKQSRIIEKAINEHIEKEVAEIIAKVQTVYKSDIFGFGDKFHQQHPKIWKNIKEQWDEHYFATATVNVKVRSKIRFGGEIREKFGQDVR